MPRSKQDELAYSALRDASGLSREQFELAYRDWYPHVKAGWGLDQVRESFSQWARERSFPDAAIAGAVAGYERVAQRGYDQPDSSSDAQTIKDAEQLLAKDASAYFKDKNLTERYQEALQRTLERGEQEREERKPAGPTMQDGKLLANIEAAMKRDGGREYWNSPDMQQLYRESIQRVIGEPGGETPGPSIDSGEVWTK